MRNNVFSIWITGLPASGKTSITLSLVDRLRRNAVYPVVLESDRMRAVLTPGATYTDEERDRFYRQLVGIAGEVVRSGVPVIIDATGSRRSYRDDARARLPNFVEVFVNSPLAVCADRDPKGIYAASRDGRALNVPGAQAVYEEPSSPELVVDGTEMPDLSADRILSFLNGRRYV